MSDQQYITTIGLEVHLQLATKTKAFCGCLNEFGREPNSCVCPVCLGFPGSLPVLNKEYLRYALKVALALNCKVSDVMRFDRKNYFYPDLPKNFQISQYGMPLSKNGFLEVEIGKVKKRIGITRVHMEEDAGKLIHDERRYFSYVDFNRSATPLLEVVSEPDIESPDEAYAYLTTLKAVFEYLEVSDCDMEKGSLRCDANISVRPLLQKGLGEKVELKNMNSFKWIKAALEYERGRQVRLLSCGKKVIQETRLWDAEKKITEPMRTKEEAHDYRYFPEPDLPTFKIDKNLLEEIRSGLPEMPGDKRTRFIKEYNISEYDASVLVADKAMSDYFESCVRLHDNPKAILNWLTGDISKHINEQNIGFRELKLKPQDLIGMLKLIDTGVISGKLAKDVIDEMLSTGAPADQIVKAKGLLQITDTAAIERFADDVLAENHQAADEYLSGKERAFIFLIGALMKKTKGSVNPQLANKILKDKLEEKRR